LALSQNTSAPPPAASNSSANASTIASFFLPDLTGTAPSAAAAVDIETSRVDADDYSKRARAGRREKGAKGGCLRGACDCAGRWADNAQRLSDAMHHRAFDESWLGDG
jgi:hypothetical protein